MQKPENTAAETIRQNIQRVIALEEDAVQGRRGFSRVAFGIGTGWFVGIQSVLIAAWLAINLRATPLAPFDPYPFSLLSAFLSLEGVVLTAFVLMRQRRAGRLADRRSHLDLQVNLLTEREVERAAGGEVSLLIEMVERLAHRLDAPHAAIPEALDLSRTSATEHLVNELHRHLPESDLDLKDV